MDEHVEKLPSSIDKALDGIEEYYVDIYNIQDEVPESGENIYSFIYSLLSRCVNNNFIPVFRAANVNNNLSFIKDIINQDDKEICIRLEDEDLINIGSILNKLLQVVESDKLHILLDFGQIGDAANAITISAIQTLNNLSLENYANVIIAATSFDTSNVSSKSLKYIDRLEWRMFNIINKKLSSVMDYITYSDYAVDSSSDFVFNPMYMHMSANIRYSADNQYIITKGSSTRKVPMRKQMPELCKKIVSLSEFKGETFSWGDKFIYDVANSLTTKIGNPTTWRTVGTNHHITLVANQLSSLSDF